MANLTEKSVKHLIHGMSDTVTGQDVGTKLNEAGLMAAALGSTGAMCALAKVATSTSTTTDFAALAVGDLVAKIPAVAGNAIFYTVATAGTLPAAAVIGDLYLAFRQVSFATATVTTKI
jgi:hypothetical protein